MNEDFSYRIPVDTAINKKYTLVMKFSEMYFHEPDMKIFDVAIGDRTVLKDLDIFRMAGHKLVPYDTFFEVVVKNGELFVDGVKSNGGLQNKNIVIKFK